MSTYLRVCMCMFVLHFTFSQPSTNFHKLIRYMPTHMVTLDIDLNKIRKSQGSTQQWRLYMWPKPAREGPKAQMYEALCKAQAL